MGGVSFCSDVFSARVRLVTNWKATPPSLVYTPLEATSCAFGNRIVEKRREFGTILDLYPRLCARSISTESPVVGGRVVDPESGGYLEWPRNWDLRPVEPSLLSRLSGEWRARGALTRPALQASVETRWGEVWILLNEG